jgi:hypothetical protein
MSKVIAFPRTKTPKSRPAPAANDPVAAFVAGYSAIGSALLLEGVDKLEDAVVKLAKLVKAMPDGEARDRAEEQLRHIHGQLEVARTMSKKVAEPQADAT